MKLINWNTKAQRRLLSEKLTRKPKYYSIPGEGGIASPKCKINIIDSLQTTISKPYWSKKQTPPPQKKTPKTVAMHLRSSRMLSREPVSPHASCFRHLISRTLCGQNARELPKPKLSTPQCIANRQKNRPGGEPTEVRTNSDPSKGCQIYHATYKFFHGHNSIVCLGVLNTA